MTNIILCGGNGTRLWPLSRSLNPKQFLKIFDNKSLFEMTIQRNKKVCKNMLIVSNKEQYFLALDQAGESEDVGFLLEPFGKNTAPAITLATLGLKEDEIVLVTPSDHLVKNEKNYIKLINEAKEFAKKGYLVTFGIKPKYPETGFGYIKADKNDVVSFKEKPDYETAKRYIEDGNYFWNSGMFMFKVGSYLEELKKYNEKIYKASSLAFENKKIFHNNVITILPEYMQDIPEDSIDYAVMEKSKKVKVVFDDIGWSDVGSFDAVSEELESSESIQVDSSNNFIFSEKLVAAIDCHDLIVVDSQDSLLICKKGSSQKVKKVVEKLKENDSKLLKVHKKVHRPWGSYEVLIEGENYKLKKIVVAPKKKLSLQKHFHRNEHWIVVSGTATVTVDDKTFLVRPNESTYIKMGEIHRLANDGIIPVVLIEAQVGEYTEEDDIVRLEDDYERL